MSTWPFFDLGVTTPRLTLRMPKDEELMPLAERAYGNVLDEENHYFLTGWTNLPQPEFQWRFLQFHWQQRANLSPEEWRLALAIFPEGEKEPVGMMDISGKDFTKLGRVSTGSWILRNWQGQGLGKEARMAMLHLAFAGLEAREAVSGAVWPDNKPSNGVSLALGYETNGRDLSMRGDDPVEVQNYRLKREQWKTRRREDIQIQGLKECLPLLGLE